MNALALFQEWTREISHAHSQSTCERFQNLPRGAIIREFRFKRGFQNRYSFILGSRWRLERASRNRSFSRMGLFREFPVTLLVSDRIGDPFLLVLLFT